MLLRHLFSRATLRRSLSTRAPVDRLLGAGKKILCVGRNYVAHAHELKNEVPTTPVVFLKPTTSYLPEGAGPILMPESSPTLHHEVELGVVIGKEAKQIDSKQVNLHIAGYVLALDMTSRIWQDAAKKKSLPWTLSKGFDTWCPVSAVIPANRVSDPHNLTLWLKVDGAVRQRGNTGNMIFRIPFLVSYLSHFFTLLPGDVILTGTPEGVGPVGLGQTLEAGIDGLVTCRWTTAAAVSAAPPPPPSPTTI